MLAAAANSRRPSVPLRDRPKPPRMSSSQPGPAKRPANPNSHAGAARGGGTLPRTAASGYDPRRSRPACGLWFIVPLVAVSCATETPSPFRGILSVRPAGAGSHFSPKRPQNSQNDTAPPPLRSASRRGLTPRSTRGPTAGQQARAAPRCTMRRAGLPSHRWPRVTSNVRPHGQHRRGSLRLASLPEAKKARVTRGGTGPQGQPVYS